MKRLIILAAMLASLAAAAQTPSTTWPYLYDNFTQGTIYMKDGAKSDVLLNVQVRHDKLHFIDKDIIREADLSKVTAVTIADDKYIPVNGEMRKIVAKGDNGAIVVSLIGDFAALQETGGGYGASSETASTRSRFTRFSSVVYKKRSHFSRLRTCGVISSPQKENSIFLPLPRPPVYRVFSRRASAVRLPEKSKSVNRPLTAPPL